MAVWFSAAGFRLFWFFGFLVFVVRCFLAAFLSWSCPSRLLRSAGAFISVFSKLFACGANLVSDLVGFLLVGFLQILM